MTKPSSLLPVVALLVVLALLPGCGNKGPLFMPDEPVLTEVPGSDATPVVPNIDNTNTDGGDDEQTGLPMAPEPAEDGKPAPVAPVDDDDGAG